MLEQYKKPDNVTFTIDDEKFVIELPSRWNRKYVRGWQERMAEQYDEEGKIEVKKSIAASRLMDYQHTSFADNCLVESPLTAEELKNDYYPLLEALFDASMVIVIEKEASADALVGKLSPISSGKPNGAGNLSSTNRSKAKEELPAPI